MLLVMSTQGVFDSAAAMPALNPLPDSTSLRPALQDTAYKTLWLSTWNRIDQFLPNFLSELFPNERFPPSSSQILMGVASGGGGVASVKGEEVKQEVMEGGSGHKGEEGAGEGAASPAIVMVPAKGEGLSQSPGESPTHSLSASPLGGGSPGQLCHACHIPSTCHPHACDIPPTCM